MKPISRKFGRAIQVLSSVLALTVAPLLTNVSHAQDLPDPSDTAKLYELAKKEGQVVWYVGSPIEPMRAIADAFEKTYPPIKVDVVRIVGPQQYQRFMEETAAGQHTADLVNFSDRPLMLSLIAEKHVANWKVPTHDRLPETARIDTHAYAHYNTDAAIVYNINKVTPEEAELLGSSWKAILDPRFAGRFAVTTQKCGSCYLAVNMFLDPALKDEYGPDFLRAIAAQKPAVYADGLVVLDRVIAGEVDIAYATFESGAVLRWKQGAPIRWVLPPPTPRATSVYQAVSSYAPHPHAARLFQNWTLSDEGLTAFQQFYGSGPMLIGSEDIRPFKKEEWYKGISSPYNVDFDRWTSNYQKDMDFWIKSIQQR